MTKLARHLKRHGLKGSYVARKAKVKPHRFYRYVRGEARPDLDEGFRIAQALDVNVTAIFDLRTKP